MIGIIFIAILAIVVASCFMPWWFFPVVFAINIAAIVLKGMGSRV